MADVPKPNEECAETESPMTSAGMIRASVITVLFGLVIFGLIWYLVPEKGRMIRAVRHSDWRIMGLAFGVLVAAITADAARLWFLCKGIGSPVPFRRIFQAIMASNFVSLITPFVSGGAPCIVWVLQQSGVNMSRASAAVIAGGIVSQSVLVFLSVALPLISGILRVQDPFSRRLLALTAGIVPVYLLGVAAVAIGSYRIDFVQRLLSSWETRLQHHTAGFWYKLRQGLKSTIGGLHNYRSSFAVLATESRTILAWAYACSLLYFIGLFTVGYLVFVALDAQVDYVRIVAAQVIILLGASAMPTPGGSGASELGAYSLFTLIAPRHVVAVFIVIWRLITYWLLLFAGSIAFAWSVRQSAETVLRRQRA